jgi:hypothetical protein
MATVSAGSLLMDFIVRPSHFLVNPDGQSLRLKMISYSPTNPTGSGLNFHCDSARTTSRSKIRLVYWRISTLVTWPDGATCTQATTRPLIPSFCAWRGKLGSTR